MFRSTYEHIRFIVVSAISPALGYLTPTKGFITALVIMFAFNIWAGMRADGVAIVRCRNFSFKKFRGALAELLLYLAIEEVVFAIMEACGDEEAALLAVKSLTYVFMYVYLQNAFRNLIYAYPKKAALHIIYHAIRLEFVKALPSKVQEMIDRIEEEGKEEGNKEEKADGGNE